MNSISEIYKELSKANIENYINSLYWLFRVENVIVKINGNNRRFLKVYIFNRKFNEQDNLMQMKFDFHGNIITIKKFQVSQQYGDNNVLGFTYEIDLADETDNLHMLSYIADGKEYILSGDIINGLTVTFNKGELHILQDVIIPEDDKVKIFPHINPKYWICCCGCVNENSQEICQICGKTKKEMNKIISIDLKSKALSWIKHKAERIDFDSKLTFNEQINFYCLENSNYYGLSYDDVYNGIDISTIREIYESKVNKEINDIISKKRITYQADLSFEENIENYLKQYCLTENIKERVFQQLDLQKLKKDYDSFVKSYELKEHKKKIKQISIGSAAVILFLLLICVSIFSGQGNHEKSKDKSNKNPAMSEKVKQDLYEPRAYAGVYSTIAISSNGSINITNVRDSKYESGQSEIHDWKDIIEISSNQYHTVGVKSDGSVISTHINDSDNNVGQDNVNDWSDIIQVSTGAYHTVGLRKDGSVVSTKITNYKKDYGQTDVENWTDIVQICAAWDHTIGLKKDGTVVSTKITNKDFDYGETNIDDWYDIVQIASDSNHTLGLKKDGTVVAVGYQGDDRCNVSAWQDVKEISTGRFYSLGLKRDGTVLATQKIDEKGDFGQNMTYDWQDIEHISAGWFHSIGLKSDGTVVSTHITKNNSDMGQEEISDWNLK